MLAVEPMDPGRTWDLLSANSSVMGNVKVRGGAPKTAQNSLPILLWYSCGGTVVSVHRLGGRTQAL